MLTDFIGALRSSPVLLYGTIGVFCALAMVVAWLVWYLEEYHTNSSITVLLSVAGAAIFLAGGLHYAPATIAMVVLITLFIVGCLLWAPIVLLRAILGWIVNLFDRTSFSPPPLTPTQRIALITTNTSSQMDALSSDYKRQVDALVSQSKKKKEK